MCHDNLCSLLPLGATVLCLSFLYKCLNKPFMDNGWWQGFIHRNYVNPNKNKIHIYIKDFNTISKVCKILLENTAAQATVPATEL